MTTGIWVNSDGLAVKFQTVEGAAGKGGEYSSLGPLRSMEFKLTLTDYTFGSTIYILDQNVSAPKAYFDRVELDVLTVATGTGATLDFGLQRTDQSTEIDYDGFIAAAPLTVLDGESGAQLVYRSEATDSVPVPVLGGALLGTTTTNVGYPCVRVNTASYTAGVIFLRLYWRPA